MKKRKTEREWKKKNAYSEKEATKNKKQVRMLACIAESNIVDIGILNTILCDAQFVCINN